MLENGFEMEIFLEREERRNLHFHLDKYAMQNEMMTLTSTYYLSLNENIDMDGIRGFVRLEKESPCKVPLE